MSETYSLADVQKMTSAPPAGGEVFSLAEVQKMQADPFLEHVRKRETTDVAYGVRRSLRDAWDTGAELLAKGYDKLRGSDEHGRVKAMNDAAREEATAGRPTTAGSVLGYVGGNAVAATPILRGGQIALTAAGAPALGNAVMTGGMYTGRAPAAGLMGKAADIATRMGGGAAGGYISAGSGEPESANTGAVIGAFAPPVLRVAGAAASGVRNVLSDLMMPAQAKTAATIAEVAGVNPRNVQELEALRNALRQEGPQIIPGQQSVPEILQSPGVSQLQRTVQAVQPAAFAARDAAREAARREVLERIAPVGPRQEVAQEVGDNISSYAIPAERTARERVSGLFDSIPPQEATMHLPLQHMQDAQTRFVGPGSFGKGEASVEQAMRTATGIGMDQATLTPRVVPFNEIQALRSSVSEAITEARMYGRNQAAAALTQMKNAIDDKVAEVAAGTRQPGEVFTPQAIDSWGQALREHAIKKSQFNTGPQAALFRQGGDGLPMAQGAEVPGRFFNAKPSQVADAQSFRRLVQDDPRLIDDLRRYAVSDAAGQTDRLGNLTSAKFNRWLDSRAGAIGETFNDQQRAWLKAIAEDLRRSDAAESLGRAKGSDTVQKAASALNLGLVDNPATQYIAGKVPFGNSLLKALAGSARTSKANRLAEMLVDPEAAVMGLDSMILRQPGTRLNMLAVDSSKGIPAHWMARTAPLGASGND